MKRISYQNHFIREDNYMNMNIVSANYPSYFEQTKKEIKKPDERAVSKTETPEYLRNTAGKEAKLSSKAQDYLKTLRKQYGDYDFFVGDSTDDLKTLAKSGTKEFSVVFSTAELERMASDEKYANEKLNCVSQAVKMSKEINQKFGFQQGSEDGNGAPAEITKIGIVFQDDGTTSFFAELEKTSAKQKERIEKAREDKKAEKEIQNYSKNNTDTKRTVVQANSMEDLLEKIRAVDWDSIKPEKMPESGNTFDFSI